MTEVTIARRVASLRRKNGLSLSQLGKLAGLSQAYLSRVENCKTALTLAGLSRLADAFDIAISYFFEDPGAESSLILCRKGQGREARFRGRQGITVELLADGKKRKLMEPLLIDVSTAKKSQPVLSHPGQEFLYVITGECMFEYGRKELMLHEGDSVYFDTDVAHALRRIEGRECRILSVVSSEDYQFHGNIARVVTK